MENRNQKIIRTSILDFYVGLLCMDHRATNGHHNLYFPGGKISIHTRKGEFQPAALHPEYGSQDFCLIVEDDLQTVKREIETKGNTPLTDIDERHRRQMRTHLREQCSR